MASITSRKLIRAVYADGREVWVIDPEHHVLDIAEMKPPKLNVFASDVLLPQAQSITRTRFARYTYAYSTSFDPMTLPVERLRWDEFREEPPEDPDRYSAWSIDARRVAEAKFLPKKRIVKAPKRKAEDALEIIGVPKVPPAAATRVVEQMERLWKMSVAQAAVPSSLVSGNHTGGGVLRR